MYKLILADDDKIIRETLVTLIDWQSLGIEVVGVCKNGLEALDCILDSAPDIVMTDIKMPGLSGLELIEKMHQLDNNIQFLILSGYKEFDFAQQALKLGVRDYLLKPVNEEKIITALRGIIDQLAPKEGGGQVADSDAGNRQIAQRVQAYVKLYLAEPELSLKWIAQKHLFMNVDYVSRNFYAQTGEKFSAYLNRVRVEQAKQLLLKKEKIHRVAEAVGCGNPRYFSQVFKKHTGLTPSDFIEQNQ